MRWLWSENPSSTAVSARGQPSRIIRRARLARSFCRQATGVRPVVRFMVRVSCVGLIPVAAARTPLSGVVGESAASVSRCRAVRIPADAARSVVGSSSPVVAGELGGHGVKDSWCARVGEEGITYPIYVLQSM